MFAALASSREASSRVRTSMDVFVGRSMYRGVAHPGRWQLGLMLLQLSQRPSSTLAITLDIPIAWVVRRGMWRLIEDVDFDKKPEGRGITMEKRRIDVRVLFEVEERVRVVHEIPECKIGFGCGN